MTSARNYVDYSLFGSDKFDPKQYANSLLLSTTDRDELLIDFSSAQNKIRFDLEEVETAVKKEIQDNWEELLDRTELTASTTEDVTALEEGLKELAGTYEKLAAKTIVPYEAAEPLYDALLNLTSTSTLLRALDRYLVNATRLNDAEGMSNITESLLELDRCTMENTALMQLRIVISTRSRVDSKRIEVVRECTDAISDLEHLDIALSNLYRLDESLLFNTLRKRLHNAIEEAARYIKSGLEVDYAIRRLQNSDNTKAVAAYVQNLKSAFDTVGAIAQRLQAIEDACGSELLQLVLDNVCDASASVQQYYWREVSGRISSLTRDAIRNNQWILRTLRSADIESIVSRGLKKGTMEYSVVYGSLSRR